ncbi:MAG: cytochrome c oxidase subunit II [Bacteroidetes bacterium CG18_big_fil_WC_8_21_14_2_50_41_14]|nr:MAG: cytochrome c oxidase subunit II [Bacteroidetes bacterium CG18_big_fil_WC_8_21_14_2_50_41_14]PJB56662.1 MAG: cytochrome c oxidase subunit II [Bacteroidetes bacterium CG_4_9_14_3_um_filter_41_19]
MNASNFVEGVDFTLYLILGISVFFLIGITFTMIYFLIRYSKKRNPVATNIEGHTGLEILWTVIPTILVVIMFYYGWTGYKPMLNAPEGAMEIEATGQMWKWTFKYPDGKVSDSLVLPVDEPVKLNLKSPDVLHSLYIPAFRLKHDVVPGGNNSMWFIPQKLGSYDILCAEYCGQLHSYMLSTVSVVGEDEYAAWLKSSPDLSNEPPGLTLLKKNACISCHTTDGTRLVGPSFKGLMGRQENVLIDGNEQTITVDRDFITQSITEPNAAITVSYQPNLMTPYKDILSDEDINKIIDYIQTLK